MKKLLVCLSLFAGFNAFAQKSKVESAVIYLRNSEIEDAKKALDEAVVNEETKNSPKMWYYRAALYDTINRNPAYVSLDKDYVLHFSEACKKCMETDTKKLYEDYCGVALINSAFACYNEAYNASNEGDYAKAEKFFRMVIDVFPYDKNEDLKKNNLSEKAIYNTMAYMSLKAKNYPSALSSFDKLMSMNYDDHLIYYYAAQIKLETGDTTAALDYISKGKALYPTEKDLINQELNIYISQGKQDVLLQKLTEAIEASPDNADLVFYKGSITENIGNDFAKKAAHCKDTANSLSKQAKLAKTPAAKTNFENAAKKFKAMIPELEKNYKERVAAAETEYKKVLEINPDYLDAYYNLGALTNNKSTAIVEKMNSIQAASQADYDKKYGALKKVQDSILTVSLDYFSKALSIAQAKEDDTAEKKKEKNTYLNDILFSLQQVYANLGDEKKAMEMRSQREALEK